MKLRVITRPGKDVSPLVQVESCDDSAVVIRFVGFTGTLTLRQEGATFLTPTIPAVPAPAAAKDAGNGRPLGSSTSPPGHARASKPLEHPSTGHAQKRSLGVGELCDPESDNDVAPSQPDAPTLPLPAATVDPVAESSSCDGDAAAAALPVPASKGGSPSRLAVIPATPLPPKKRRGVATASDTPAAASAATDVFPLGSTTASVLQAANAVGFKVLETRGSAPSPRWGHAAFMVEGANKMVVYGGFSSSTTGDCTVLNLNTMTWSSPMNCESLPRVWHAGTVLPGRHAVLFYGGERSPADGSGGGAPEFLGDMMIFDTDLLLWYPPASSGPAPSTRGGHSLTAVGDVAVLFGGVKTKKWLADVSILRLDNFRWKSVSPLGKGPCARSYHTATAVGSRVVFFGGNDALRSYNDVYVLEYVAGHVASLVGPTTILIHGGWDPVDLGEDDAVPLDDAFLLNTVTWEWMRVDFPKGGSLCRSGHSVCVSNAGDLGTGAVVFGGIDADGVKTAATMFLPVTLPPSLC